MSWAQRRGPNRPNPTTNPPVQMYNPNQHSNTENQWQATNPQAWYDPSQEQQLKPEPTSQHEHYWQQGYGNQGQPQQNANVPNNTVPQHGQGYQQEQAGYYQNASGYEQQAFGNMQYNQQYNQNNVYSGQPTQQSSEGDAWNKWGWGDEDNSNAQPISESVASTAPSNSIGESFAKDDSWNWSLMDSQQQQNQLAHVTHQTTENSLFPTVGDLKEHQTKPDHPPQVLKTSRNKLDTPQWSTESQPSLESSDDILHTSESDKSHMVSRSSTISHSPISGHESLPAAQGLSTVESIAEASGNRQYHFENKEIVKQDVAENRSLRVNPTPPPPKNTQTPPLMPPPQGTDDSRNPYKRTTGLSHKSVHKSRQLPLPPSFPNHSVNLETLPDNSEHPDHPVTTPITTTTKSLQHWPQAENNEAPINDRNQYLETGQLSDVNLAEGNEGPDLANDTLPPPGLQRMVPGQMEQNEIVGRGRDEPLPGFSRMVLGQNETGPIVSGQAQTHYDPGGPPEGLHRMIPGESSSPETSLRQPNIEENDSELELNQLTQNPAGQPRSATIGADTPPAIQNPPTLPQPTPPSVVPNRSETIGGGLATPSGGDGGGIVHVRGASASSGDSKAVKSGKSKDGEQQGSRREFIEGQTNDNTVLNLTNSIRNLTVGENLTDGQTSNTSLPEHSPRRHSRQESSDSESDRKHSSRNHREKRAIEKSKFREKERDRYKDRDGERDRYKDSDRYSPDPYRDKRDRRDRRHRDRRYEEDTDYFSDKEKDRRAKDDRDRDYERKYSSLKKDKDRRRKERDSRDYRDPIRGDYYYSRYGDEYATANRSRPSSRSDSMHESFRERRREPDARDRRHRERDRERDRHNRGREQREAFNPYQSFAYDPYNPYYQQYQYYENLRRTNPQAYAEWYRKYYQQATGSAASFTGEDRASVHSGRSSANDELAKDRYTRQSFYSQSSISHLANYYGQSQSLSGHYGLDNSSYNRTFDQTDNSLIYEDQPSAAQRLTPAKFATAHIKASINSGKLIRILPNYPMDGQNAIVEVCNLQTYLDNDKEYIELSSFPGPLVKGVTHKKQIIEYCDSKIKGAAFNRDIDDIESYVLMWELLILLIRQNGMVVGTDIAELLLKNRSIELAPRPLSALSATSSIVGEGNQLSEASNQPISEMTGSTHSILKEEEVTRKFREYLLYGSCKEALEWAMKHGLWGHALFLASKLDKRTYANVMMRFANGLTINDPLQTLYQLLSGKMPAAVTCVCDEKWGDWRPHLAMILSNSTQRPELNCKAITTLGDTLLSRGGLYAAQFCYLMAEVGFGKHDDPETRMVLLGSDHRKPYPQFVTNEAIHMTEIYEYACSLNDQGFLITEFQFYKYLSAARLADYGLLEKALQYLEKLAGHIIYNPSCVSTVLVDRVCELADKLKFNDPVGDAEDESEFGGMLETSRPDNSWLKDLRAVQSDYQTGRITNDSSNNYVDLQSTLNPETALQSPNYNLELWQQQQQQQYEQQYQAQQQQQQQQVAWQPEQQVAWQPEQQTAQTDYQIPDNQQQNDVLANQYQEQQSYWSGQQTQQQPWGDQSNQYSQEMVTDQQQNYYEGANNRAEQEVEKEPSEDLATQPPQISMPNQPNLSGTFSDQSISRENKENVPQTKQQSPKQEIKQSTGWFGGIFSKLSMKPKNQMKLPEDKNPKIVWDQDKKRWTNVDEDPTDPANEFKPPPKMSDLMPKMPPRAPQATGMGFSSAPVSSSSLTLNQNQSFHSDARDASEAGPASIGVPATQPEDNGLPKPAQPNMFKLKRGRNLKNSYIDVFNKNGTKTSSGPSSLPGPEKVPAASLPQMNFFIPQPNNDPNAPMDFLTPAPPLQLGEQQQQ